VQVRVRSPVASGRCEVQRGSGAVRIASSPLRSEVAISGPQQFSGQRIGLYEVIGWRVSAFVVCGRRGRSWQGCSGWASFLRVQNADRARQTLGAWFDYQKTQRPRDPASLETAIAVVTNRRLHAVQIATGALGIPHEL
jgi:hypothetical protein